MTYKPSSYVQTISKFSSKPIDSTQEYAQSLLLVPIILFGLGILAMLFMDLGFLGRCCIKSCVCGPPQKPEDEDEEDWGEFLRLRGARLVRSVIFLSFLIVVIDQLILIGNNIYISDGVNLLIDTLDDIKTLVTNFQSYTVQLLDKILAIVARVNNLSCSNNFVNFNSYKTDITSDTSKFEDAINKFKKLCQTLINGINDVEDYITTYAIYYRNLMMYAIYLFPLVGAFIFLFFQILCRTAHGVRFSIFWGHVTYVIILVLGAVWLVAMIPLADICMDPLALISDRMSAGDTKNTLLYFTECQGVSPLGNYTNKADDAINKANDTLVSLYQDHVYYTNLAKSYGHPEYYNCSQVTPFYNAQESDIAIILTLIDELLGLIGCQSIMPIWEKFMYQAVCDKLFMGLFTIWVSQLIVSFLYFVTMLIASFSYLYFDHLHGTVKDIPVLPDGDGAGAGNDKSTTSVIPIKSQIDVTPTYREAPLHQQSVPRDGYTEYGGSQCMGLDDFESRAGTSTTAGGFHHDDYDDDVELRRPATLVGYFNDPSRVDNKGVEMTSNHRGGASGDGPMVL